MIVLIIFIYPAFFHFSITLYKGAKAAPYYEIARLSLLFEPDPLSCTMHAMRSPDQRHRNA